MTCDDERKPKHIDSTLPANPQWIEDILQKITSGRASPPTGVIALYFLGRVHPLLIEMKKERMVIGRQRSGTGQSDPDIDLTAYQATMHGVSRAHAAILQKGDGYALEDLGSTNGSWINERQIQPKQPQPLENGDLIRLGQFVFFIHFSG